MSLRALFTQCRCTWIRTNLTVALALLASATARATNYNEVEPNDNKGNADANGGVMTMVAGDTITGTTTGSSTTTPGPTSVDYFNVETGPLAVGIYRHQLALTSATLAHTGTIRGLSQTGGIINFGTDEVIQTSTTTAGAPPRTVVWYGFGKQENLYVRVTGVATTTQPYVATLSTTGVTPTTIGPFISGVITIDTDLQTTANTEIFVFDSNLDPIPTYLNDNRVSGDSQSTLTRTYTPGTYYMAITSANSATDEPAAPDEGLLTGDVMDYSGSLVRNASSTLNADWDFIVTDGNGTQSFTNQTGTNFSYQVTWFTFEVQTPSNPPPNDACGAAVAIESGQTLGGTTLLATNDGSATCDPGGASSRDVWYSFTSAHAGYLSIDTCGTALDTVISAYSGTCGSLTELGCDDNCGASCSGPSSCLLSVHIDAGTHFIRVSDKGLGSEGGDFGLHAAFVPDSSVACDAVVITSVPFNDTIDNSQSPDSGLDLSCSTSANDGNFPIWYTYTPSSDCTMQIRELSTQNVDITVYAGSCGGLSEYFCTTAENTAVGMLQGTQYWILISAPTTTQPSVPLDLQFDCVTPPPNDGPCGATEITSLPFADVVSNGSASPDPDVSCNTAAAQIVPHGVWYTYTATSDCSMEIDENSTQGVVWAAYTGADCSSLVPYFCSPNDQNDHVDMFTGTKYWFLVGLDSSAATIPTTSVDVHFDCQVPADGEACPVAIEIGSLPFSTTIDTDTFGAHMPGAPCDSNFGTTQNDAWFKFTATENCTMLVSATFGASDGLFSVWEGPSCSNKTLVLCRDQTTSATSPGSREAANVSASAGQTYWIQVGDNGSTEDGGPVDLVMTCGPPPANDEACGATVIAATPFTDTLDISAASADVWMNDPVSTDSSNQCGSEDPPLETGYGVWYTYTPTSNCTLIIEETSSENNVVFGAFVGTCAGLTQIDCTGSAFEAMSVGLTAGTQYWFLVGIYDASPPALPPAAPISLTFECRPAPVNDLPCNAVNLNSTGLPFNETVDVAAATHDVDMSGTCNATSANLSSNGVWYTYTPDSTCTALIQESSSLNAAIAVYSGPDCSSLTELACTGNESFTFGMSPGTQYWILVALGTANPGLSDPSVLLDVTIDCANPPANDLPCGATVISSTPYSVTQTNALATNDVDTACNSTAGTQETQKGVWWQYTPSGDCMAQISETSSVDVTIAVLSGADCNNLTVLACTSSDHFGFVMNGGQTYWILVGLFTNTATVPSANLALSFNCVSADPPANDTPCGATVLTSLPFADTPVNATATPDMDVSGSCNATAATNVPFGVWYQYTPTTDCGFLTSENSIQTVSFGIFTGPDCNSLTEVACTTTEGTTSHSLSANTTYWILVGSDAAAPTTPGVPLSINFDCPNTLTNETCSTASEITSLPFSLFYNNFIQTGSPPAGSCNEFGQTQQMLHDVWFRWTAPENCTVTLTIQGPPSPSDPMAAIYTGTECGTCSAGGCTGLTEVDCINRAAGSDGPIDLIFNASAGTTYWFQAGDSGTLLQGGPTTFTLEGPCGSVACATCPGDMTGESTLNGQDVSQFTACYISANGGPPTAGCGCANINGDGVVDDTDVTQFVNRLLAPPPCP